MNKPLYRSVLLLMTLAVLLTAAPCTAAGMKIWVTLDDPPAPPSTGEAFATALRVSAWNGTVGALDVSVRFDPKKLSFQGFAENTDSRFSGNCYVDASRLKKGQMRIICYTTLQENEADAVTVGTLQWQASGEAGSVTDITLTVNGAVSAAWDAVDSETYGIQVTVADGET